MFHTIRKEDNMRIVLISSERTILAQQRSLPENATHYCMCRLNCLIMNVEQPAVSNDMSWF
jgi:hypothetical protein